MNVFASCENKFIKFYFENNLLHEKFSISIILSYVYINIVNYKDPLRSYLQSAIHNCEDTL